MNSSMHITKFVPLLRPWHSAVVSLRHCANCSDIIPNPVNFVIAYQHTAQCHLNLYSTQVCHLVTLTTLLLCHS